MDGETLVRGLRKVVRLSGVLEPHEHAGVVVTVSDIVALDELARSGPVTQGELAERLGLEKSTVSRLAAALEERGWLGRERDAVNRRYLRLALTPEGRDVAARILAELAERHERLLGAMSAADRQALLQGLAALGRVVDAHHPR